MLAPVSLWWLAPALLLGVVVHLGATALAGRALGVAVVAAQLGMGPHLRLWRRPALRIGLLPLGGWVELAGMAPVAAGEAPWGFGALSPGRQALVHLAGPVAVFGLSCVVLGLSSAAVAALGLPAQLGAALSPAGLTGLLAGARALAPAALVGHTLAKLAAANLLPLPGLAGGAALGALLRPAPRLATVLAVGARLGMLAWVVAVGVALVRAAGAG